MIIRDCSHWNFSPGRYWIISHFLSFLSLSAKTGGNYCKMVSRYMNKRRTFFVFVYWVEIVSNCFALGSATYPCLLLLFLACSVASHAGMLFFVGIWLGLIGQAFAILGKCSRSRGKHLPFLANARVFLQTFGLSVVSFFEGKYLPPMADTRGQGASICLSWQMLEFFCKGHFGVICAKSK